MQNGFIERYNPFWRSRVEAFWREVLAMQLYFKAAVERAMKVQEGILRAVAKMIT